MEKDNSNIAAVDSVWFQSLTTFKDMPVHAHFEKFTSLHLPFCPITVEDGFKAFGEAFPRRKAVFNTLVDILLNISKHKMDESRDTDTVLVVTPI